MNALKNILVGLDFTTPSQTALSQALRLADRHQARVKAVHVVDIVVSIDVAEALAPMHVIAHDQLVGEAKAQWASFKAKIPGAENVDFHCEVNGRVYGMLRYARAAKPDLIVIGARDAKPETGFGTIAAACVREGPCDTLLVRERQTGPFKTILVGVDFSAHSMRALEQAVRIARQDDAVLHVVHVFTPPSAGLGFTMRSIDLSVEREREMARDLERKLREFAKPLDHELAYLTTHFNLHHHAGHRSGLVSCAEKVGADLLVLGTRGKTNIRDVLLGSTAEKVLRQATGSVLAIRAV
jgi:universal stress protein E